MKDEHISLFVIVFIVTFGICYVGIMLKGEHDRKKGYIECIMDVKNNRAFKYILVEQANGTTEWEENKEYKTK